jgi:hypothetical protein
MLDALSVPPRLILRALDDLHTVAARLGELVESVRILPRTEDELSASIVLLREDIRELNGLLRPLIASLEPMPAELQELRAMLRKLPGI